jgi:Flp pilus assembly protein CpaB
VSASPAPAVETIPNRSTELRIVPSRRTLPGSRAVVGGILVALAVLGTYAATTTGGNENSATVLVATHDIAPGTRLQASDFRSTTVDLDPSLAGRVVQSSDKLAGATVLGPLSAGDVLATSAVSTSNSTTPYFEVAFSLPASRALDGALRPGETVDILSTDKTSPASAARIAAANARVLRTQNGGGSIGESGDVTVTVGVTTKSDAATIAAAVDLGQVTLVRTTGTAAR